MEQRKRNYKPILLSILVTLILYSGIRFIYLCINGHDIPKDSLSRLEECQIKEPSFKAQKKQTKDNDYITRAGIISKGENLYLALKKIDIHNKTIHLISSQLSPLFDFRRKTRPGDSYRIIQDPNIGLINFEYNVSPLEKYILGRDKDNKWEAKRENIKLDKYWVRFEGEISGSLFLSFNQFAHGMTLASKFTDIFAWKIDFLHETRNGDTFAFVIEKYCHDNEFVQYGDILAAEYNNKKFGKYSAFYFSENYYSPNARSIKQAFLRAPLNYKYISSGYTHRRLHPILHKVKPHLGVDFAAPMGTPIWAVADGTVIKKKYDRFNGNQIVLRHINGYKTYYNHLSSFARGIKVGSKVKQKQTIAHVGTTGLSTGPHLDYRLKKNGKFVNPLLEKFPKGVKLPETKLSSYKQWINEIDPILCGEKDYNNIIVASIDSSTL